MIYVYMINSFKPRTEWNSIRIE